ncbi:hypothetical protein [uncultured Selenomonas sp.]
MRFFHLLSLPFYSLAVFLLLDMVEYI